MSAGSAALLATRLPGAGELAGGLVLAAVLVAGLALLFRRRPDLFPLVAIFALPFRVPISAGGRTVNLLVPLYLVVAAGTIALLLPALMRRMRAAGRRGERGGGAGRRRGAGRERVPAVQVALAPRRRMAAARSSRAVRAADALLRGPRQGSREHRLLLHPLRAPVRAPAPGALGPRAAAEVPRGRGRAGGRVRGHRLRRVPPQGAVPEPEGRRGEPVRQLLPGELAVLRPQHLRALPRPRDDRGDDRRAVEPQPARHRDLRGRARVAARRPDHELLAVEHRRAAAGPRAARRLALELARHARRLGRAARARRRARAARAREPALRAEGLERVHEQRDERAHEADLGRARTVRAAPARGIRRGLLRNGVQATPPDEQRERDLGVPHDPRHGRRGAGPRGARRLRRAARGRVRRAVHAARGARRRGSRSRPASRGSCCTPGRTPTSSRTRSHGRCSLSAWRSRRRPRRAPRRRRARRAPRCSSAASHRAAAVPGRRPLPCQRCSATSSGS